MAPTCSADCHGRASTGPTARIITSLATCPRPRSRSASGRHGKTGARNGWPSECRLGGRHEALLDRIPLLPVLSNPHRAGGELMSDHRIPLAEPFTVEWGGLVEAFARLIYEMDPLTDGVDDLDGRSLHYGPVYWSK